MHYLDLMIFENTLLPLNNHSQYYLHLNIYFLSYCMHLFVLTELLFQNTLLLYKYLVQLLLLLGKDILIH